MSFTLALDTALDRVQASVVEDGVVRGHSGASSLGDSESIGIHVDTALAEAGIEPAALSRVAVTVGPGSFTGVRVSIAYAKGLALALGVPAVGVSTLEVLAGSAGGAALAVVDARHGAVFAGLYQAPGAEPAVLARIAATACVDLAATHGVPIVGPASAVAATGAGDLVEVLNLAVLSRLAAGDPTGREPRALYLADVDAVPQIDKALARA